MNKKICPRCQAVSPLTAQTCLSCGHIFRTQFASPLPPPLPPPLPRKPFPLWLAFGIPALVFVAAILVTILRLTPPAPVPVAQSENPLPVQEPRTRESLDPLQDYPEPVSRSAYVVPTQNVIGVWLTEGNPKIFKTFNEDGTGLTQIQGGLEIVFRWTFDGQTLRVQNYLGDEPRRLETYTSMRIDDAHASGYNTDTGNRFLWYRQKL